MINAKRPKLNKNIAKELTPQVLHYIDNVYEKDKLSKLIDSVISFEKSILNKDPNFINKPRKVFLNRVKKLQTDKDKLEAIIDYYVLQIDGKFIDWIYRTLSAMLRIALTLVLYPFSLWNLVKALFFSKNMLNQKIKMDVDIAKIKELEKKGTLIFVPNHTSNYDSLLISNRLNYLKLAPPMWGAGLNLYNNPINKFVMNNVGCYKVDRRNKTVLYLEVLKQYSRFYLEKGFNTIFYPGGTRSRSGAIEQKLKLGLLGTVIDAFVEKKEKNKYFIIPLIITYTAVPEARNLSYDYFYGKVKRKKILKELKAKQSFFLKLKKIYKNIRIDNNIHIKFGDVFTPDGKKLLSNYPKPINGKTIFDRDYNKELTASLGKSISKEYAKYNNFSKLNVFCKAIINSYLINNNSLKEMSNSELIKEMKNKKINYADTINAISSILQALDGENYLLRNLKPIELFRESLDILTDFVKWDGKKIIILTPELVFYYANKLNFL